MATMICHTVIVLRMTAESINAGAEMPRTSVQMSMATRDRIKTVGRMGDSYEDVINRLIDFWEQHHKEEK